ncbi:MAG: ABC transporter permease [Marinilabiliaceae bacterium]|jgi:putative ABC transport system permease protein|nr:ABC transporter permease [Marinilabiliaceae bacterium]
MYKNFFKSFLRSVGKNRITFAVNIAGFTFGMAACILIFMFVYSELTYDRHHQKADRIYRLAVQAMIGDTRINQTSSSARVQRELRERYPEIENSVKLIDIGRSTIKYKETVFAEEEFVFSDSTFFDIFSARIIEGEFEKPLSRPNTLALSKSYAEKYFGKERAIGKKIELNNQYLGTTVFDVVAVFEDMPSSSHFHFNQLATVFSFPSLVEDSGWSRNIFVNYLLLREGASAAQLEAKFEDYVRQNIGDSPQQYDTWVADGNYWKFFLQPLKDIHLRSDLNNEWESNGNIKYVFIFSAIGLFVLIIACINFVNLSTARSTLRSREVGVRKVSGSTKAMLVRYFLGESFITTIISLLLALLLVSLVLPYYSNWLDRDLSLNLFGNILVLPALIIAVVLVSLVNGIYPAFVLSSFDPTRVLKGKMGNTPRGIALRNTLVVIQFAASIFLIIGTIVVNKELLLLQGNELGFNKKNLMLISTSPESYAVLKSYKDELASKTGVVAVAASNTLPGMGFSNWGFGAEGIDNTFTLNVLAGDYDFINTMQFDMADGRFFQPDHPSDSAAALLNETAVKVLGIENPIGLRINNLNTERQYYTVVGVVKDFHYESLHSEVRPMAMMLQGGIYQDNVSFLTVRYKDGYETDILNYAENLWNDLIPGVPFVHSYFEEDYNRLYNNEQQTRQVFTLMAFLSILVACLGLFGLSAFISQQRAGEVAIRKVFGSSIREVITLLLRKYTLWIVLAFMLASPIAYYVMSKWLQNFAYKVHVGPLVFVIALIISLLLAYITISANTLKTARINPADALRHE